MRGFFRRRRRRTTLLWAGCVCVLASFCVWAFSQRQLFYQTLKGFLEQEGTRALGFQIQIESLRTTPWGEGIFRGLALRAPEGPLLLTLREVRIPFDIDQWFRRPDLHFSFRDGTLLGDPLQLSGLEGKLFLKTTPKIGLLRGALLGTWRLFDERGAFRLTFRRRNPLWVEGALSVEKTFFKLDLFQKDPDRLEGALIRFRASPLTANGKPLGSLWGLVRIEEDLLTVRELSWEESVRLSGTLSRHAPFQMRAQSKLNFSREQLERWFGQTQESTLPEQSKGRIEINGPLLHPHLEGEAEARNGWFQDQIPYQWIHGTLYGTWPHVTVEAAINHGPSRGFSFTRGLIDMKAFGTPGWYKTVAVEPSHELAAWQGLELRVPSEDVMTIGKSDARQSVRLKRSLDENSFDKEEDTFEWEYRLPSKRILKMRLEEKDAFVGVGERIQF